MTYRKLFSSRHAVPQNAAAQSEPLPGQVPNNAGGHWYALDDWARLDRFLVLGSEGGTYYVGERQLTADNAHAVARCLSADGRRVVARAIEISEAGRAPKNDPALFVLAMATAAADEATRRAALAALPRVARTGTHLLSFADMVEGFRGWGRGLRRAVAGWFIGQDADRIALQAVKYMNRGGWSLRDLLRLAHPLTDDVRMKALFDWIAHPGSADAVAAARTAFPLVEGMFAAREADGPAAVAAAIRAHRLPREAVPTERLSAPEVWEALLESMPATALIRNLGKLSQVGLLSIGSDVADRVVRRLSDGEALTRARVHPVQILLALKTYAQGRGERGKLQWTPVPAVVDALDEAFYRAFATVAPTGKRLLVGVDVSGSMNSPCIGSAVLHAYEAAAAMAMTFVHSERHVEVVGFDTEIHTVALSARQRLDDVVRTFKQWSGGTDTALPIQHALRARREFDAIVVLTDNETWAGKQHPVQALRQYRETVNPAAKAVVLATAANTGSVVPDGDPLSLGCAGFDAAVPQVVAEFVGR
ncbi:putative 60 kDa SS-A/Ro ribonucleoprotein homolog [Magnetospirillum sp. XM-1]|uniref:TROVE domain-containing protein n=1 Tax=Magnetospirillum sp. XM-1 TaxID=1663591 RepID=UPI00073DB85F|nr:TROVE domain-containing protein [Magnetospirillum sp. XM-1]CUW37143.1 putative 60 kDa SS-A/Ro ribonucleoprotein homolog [Magnetospirillum sp. XM-1]